MDLYESLFTYCGYRFNEPQRLAISHFEGPSLTLAVPGSGKTTLLLARTVSLVSEWGVNPNQILTMTFSKAAALDMDARYKEKYKPHFKYDLKFGTIHSFSYRILKTWRKRRNLPLLLVDGDGESKYEILSKLYRKVNNDYLGEEAYEELSNALSYAKNMMLLPTEFETEGLKFPQLAKLYVAYEKYKQDKGLIDFDDMLSETLYALQEDVQLLETIRQSYPFIQVDETQDTSKLQHELIKLIAYPKNNLFVVADDDQSIYGFRGAFPEMILNFDKAYPGSVRYYLDKNYRSKDEILKVCSASIINNTERYAKNLSGVRGDGGCAKLIYFEGIEERNTHLEHLVRAFVETADNQTKEFGILYRNHMSALSIIDSLMQLDIPFEMKDGKQKISNKWLVKDIAAFLAWSKDPSNLQAFEKICFRTNARISRQMLEYVRANHRGRSIIEVLIETSGSNANKVRLLRVLESNLNLISQTSAVTALDLIEKELGYSEFITYATENMGYSELGINNLWTSLKAIGRKQDRLQGLLDRLQVIDGYIATHQGKAQVKLSTIHASKGQEYDSVILVDINQGLLPSVKVTNKPLTASENRTLEEDRRLFYVGLSRAKESVYILHAKFLNGDYISPSPFIKEIEKALEVSVVKANGSEHGATGNSSNGFGSNNGLTSNSGFVSDSSTILESPWAVGDFVVHAKFGRGQILSIDKDHIAIGFDDKIRDLSLRVCIENKILC